MFNFKKMQTHSGSINNQKMKTRPFYPGISEHLLTKNSNNNTDNQIYKMPRYKLQNHIFKVNQEFDHSTKYNNIKIKIKDAFYKMIWQMSNVLSFLIKYLFIYKMSENIKAIVQYVEEGQYQAAVRYFERYKPKEMEPVHYLTVAKAYFGCKKYNQCLNTIQNIDFIQKLPLYYESCLLIYKCKYIVGKPLSDLNTLQSLLKNNQYYQQFLQVIRQVKRLAESFPNKTTHKQDLYHQYQTFQELLRKAGPMQEGKPTFLISSRWLDSWQAYVKQQSAQCKYPGPITQFQILDHRFDAFFDKNPQKTYTNIYLIKSEHYKYLTKSAWNFLKSRYDGFEIKRFNLSTSLTRRDIIAQVNLKQIKISKDQNPLNFYCVQITKKQTWEGLQKKLYEEWGKQESVICQFIPGKDEKYPINLTKRLQDTDTQGKLYLYTTELKKNVTSNNKGKVNMEACATCGKKESLKYCQCLSVKYCNADCQKADRQKHRKKCQIQCSYQKRKGADMESFDLKERDFGGNKGLVGLKNLGNTCYMNSGLQCLSNTQEITEYFMSNNFINDINHSNPLGTKGNLACAYAELVRQLWAGRQDVISPFKLKRTIGTLNSQFLGYSQHDSQQFISYLIDGLQQDLNLVQIKQTFQTRDEVVPDEQASRQSEQNYAKRIKAYIRDIMSGQFKSTVICSKCNKISICFDPFLLVSLPIPQPPTIKVFYIQFQCRRAAYGFSFPLQDSIKLSSIKDKLLDYQYSSYNQKKYILQMKAIRVKTFTIIKQFTEDQLSQISVTKFKQLFPECEIFCYQFVKEYFPVCQLQYYYKTQCMGFPKYIRWFKNDSEHDKLRLIVKTFESFCKRYEDPFKFIDSKLEVSKTKNPQVFALDVKLNQRIQMCTYTDKQLYDSSKPAIFNLQDCLKQFSIREKLEKQNQWYCNKCKAFNPATKQMQIYKANKILVLAFKKFTRIRKISANIKFPIENLDLGPYLLSNKQKKKIIYDLYGVVNHYGTMGGGHYTAFCKNFIDRKWYEFNDSRVREISPKDVVTEDAYVLFFRRRD